MLVLESIGSPERDAEGVVRAWQQGLMPRLVAVRTLVEWCTLRHAAGRGTTREYWGLQ
jgi:hypothetical protein